MRVLARVTISFTEHSGAIRSSVTGARSESCKRSGAASSGGLLLSVSDNNELLLLL